MTLQSFPNALKHETGDVLLAPDSVDYIGPLTPACGLMTVKPYRAVYLQSGAAAFVADGPALSALVAELVTDEHL